MGIPKFFRWISERYPLTSQLIQENKIPEFDNLYLDFNAIIHNCSHPNDEDAHFRLSEQQIFTAIFAYVDHLFGKIKPKKLFFMAVDGVAPRAKMNQQRSRRFRTAKEVKEVRQKAEAKGETLPEEKAFDSNCITPGTPFMAKLSEQLKYFVNKKITEDSNWRDVEVVLSGHDVPGEGEHKIMEYIRLSRSQPEYDPNLRHCLYGLDADLIMLGLLSHDPHFCLLREEVKFGPARKSRGNSSLDSINFYLLHLSLFREYLHLEFHTLSTELPFPYSLERVIDDFILLAVFVGNDFLPNLPDLHIHENGLEKLFEVYKKVLPTLEGYINDAGTINLPRLQCILDEMAQWEVGVFEREYSDLNWYKGKQSKYKDGGPNKANGNALVLSEAQHEIFRAVRDWVMAKPKTPLTMPNTFSAKDRKFILTVAQDLHLSLAWDGYDEEGNNLVSFAPFVPEDPSDDEEDIEAQDAVFRVLRKYEKADIHVDDGDFDSRAANALSLKMDEWKRTYYSGKLEISYDNPEPMQQLVYRYVEGLQWVMYYYFTGVKSWSWFFDYHYAPRISDLSSTATWGGEGGKAIRGIAQLSFDFELGHPFRPYEQLMGVLPVASKEHIPAAYHDLMTNPNSSISDFYPDDFEQDLNGKKADWEAIVKIPFIDQERLLAAMSTKEHLLTAAEKQRNTFGTTTRFTFRGLNAEPTEYPSSLPGFFPPLYRCMCKMEAFDLPTLDPDLGLVLVTGLVEGVRTGPSALSGFPSLNTLPHTHTVLGYHHVNVHNSESRNQSIVVHIRNTYEGRKTEEIGQEMLGKRTFVGWPFLSEGRVVAVSDELFRYESVQVGMRGRGAEKVLGTPHNQNGLGLWKTKADRIEGVYSKRFGVVTGPVEVLLHVRPLKGLKPLEDGSFIKEYEGVEKETEVAVQMSVSTVGAEDPRYVERSAPPLSEEFPEESKIFFLGEHAYGVAAQVSATTETSLAVILAFFPSDKTENSQFKAIVQETAGSSTYYPAFRAAEMLGLSSRGISKITSSFMVITSDNQKHNLGLSMKFEAKSLKVVDYSRKDGRHWEFSDKAIKLLQEYQTAFPDIFDCLNVGGDAMLRATDVFAGSNPDARVKEIKLWLKSKGVRDFEAVSLFCDQLSKKTVAQIEKLADNLTVNKSSTAIKKAIVKGIPRQAVLKPAHAVYRLQGQRFGLGDRVTMVQDSGGVPLAAKGVVVGLNSKSMDVVWDVPFMSGTTLGDRCSEYRGLTVEFSSCLNLSDPQFVTSTNPKEQKPPVPVNHTVPFKPRFGPHPEVKPAPGQAPAAGFRSAPVVASAPASSYSAGKPVHIMTNPNRGASTGARGGRGGFGNHTRGPLEGAAPLHSPSNSTGAVHAHVPRGRGAPRGFGGGGFRGRGFAPPTFDRGRGRGFRGRGRGFAPTTPLPS
ncbi:XRN 5'-3' exonuclease N-terminus-domain-containing protein [Rhodocollybia butyracea]|uniref:5'-3' exoribonuclease 1 n=1 Tax=Rhodocollybia butyracea TaxID=206335 RepID=A0A9P5UCW1_9AGAR|nr:XRN 5'-3' exonuclease N-terminus-domain-containing protein [Rhodocollybia butyracea]